MGQEDDSVDGVNSVALPGCCHLCTHTHTLIGVLCVCLQVLYFFFATFFLYLLGHVTRE